MLAQLKFHACLPPQLSKFLCMGRGNPPGILGNPFLLALHESKAQDPRYGRVIGADAPDPRPGRVIGVALQIRVQEFISGGFLWRSVS